MSSIRVVCTYCKLDTELRATDVTAVRQFGPTAPTDTCYHRFRCPHPSCRRINLKDITAHSYWRLVYAGVPIQAIVVPCIDLDLDAPPFTETEIRKFNHLLNSTPLPTAELEDQ